MTGYIALHRKILDWQWGDDPLTGWLWVRLLLTANYEDKKWRGIVIKRGQLVTTLSELSEQTGLSFKQIRSRLNKLIESGCVGKQTTNKYTILTICKYDDYQFAPDDISEQRANKGQTKGKQMGKQRANKQDTQTHCDTDSYPRTENEEGKQRANKGQTNGQTLYISNKEINNISSSSSSTACTCEENSSGGGSVLIESGLNKWKRSDIVTKEVIPELTDVWMQEIREVVSRFCKTLLTNEQIAEFYEDFKAQEATETLEDSYKNWREHFRNFVRKSIKLKQEELKNGSSKQYVSLDREEQRKAAADKRKQEAAALVQKYINKAQQSQRAVQDAG